MHNYISINNATIKSQYSIYRIDETIDILIKKKFKVYFFSDANADY